MSPVSSFLSRRPAGSLSRRRATTSGQPARCHACARRSDVEAARRCVARRADRRDRRARWRLARHVQSRGLPDARVGPSRSRREHGRLREAAVMKRERRSAARWSDPMRRKPGAMNEDRRARAPKGASSCGCGRGAGRTETRTFAWTWTALPMASPWRSTRCSGCCRPRAEAESTPSRRALPQSRSATWGGAEWP